MKRLFTSESVTEGHPDKVCDKISDAILDEVLKQDPKGRVACEVCCTTGLVMVMGEFSTTAEIDIPSVVRGNIIDIGYRGGNTRFDGSSCAVMLSIDKQSLDIARGTNDFVGGAGDQGMMFGYACTETKDLMPLPITLAHRLAYRLAQVRKKEVVPWFLPDGKTQVTVEYDEFGRPRRLDTILISTQHEAWMYQTEVKGMVGETVVDPVLKELAVELPNFKTDDYRLLVNPTGRFVEGGPAVDTGLTGRKIIVDTYGGYGAHGGGAFSGKDPTKVDRSGAYAARHIAKNIVAASLAEKCQVQIAYAIGVAEPVSIMVDTFGTGMRPDDDICKAVSEVFDLTPKGIIKRLGLRKPIYRNTASYGHFGSVIGEDRSWERLDYTEKLKEKLL